MLNIGCGPTTHPDWVNLDVASADPDVLTVDINHGLPFPTGSAAVCYSSHVLEHLDKPGARNLVAECFRVLKPGGVIRLVLPDMEALAREYLRILDAVSSGGGASDLDYDWIMLELYDQAVRNYSGGEMAHFLERLDEKSRGFVRSRIGVEAEKFWGDESTQPPRSRPRAWAKKNFWGKALTLFREKLAGWLVYAVGGRAAYRNYRLGIFRSSGEVHQWMYDRHSMKRLLDQAGFVNVKICGATESRIPEFEKYSLDVLNGVVRKPDSLYVEASKP